MTATNGFKALGPRAPFLGLHIAQSGRLTPCPFPSLPTSGTRLGVRRLGGMSWEALRCPACSGVKHGGVHGQPGPAPHHAAPGSLRAPGTVRVLSPGCGLDPGKWGLARSLLTGPAKSPRCSGCPRTLGLPVALPVPGAEVPLRTLGPGFGQKWRKGVEQRLPPQEERPLQTSGAWGDHRQGLTEGGTLLPRGDSFFFPFFFLR